MYQRLRLILGDQLHHGHSWYRAVDSTTIYVLMECRSETDYVRHHVQKVLAFFAAMRAFAAWLRDQGHQVHYLTLNDPDNQASIAENLRQLVRQFGVSTWAYQQPDEYRLDQALQHLAQDLGLPVEVADTEHFLAPREGLAELFKGKKTYLLETFYRAMRKRYGLLMEPDGVQPLSGRWNFDAENRRRLPDGVPLPAPLPRSRNVEDLLTLLKNAGVATIGTVDAAHFDWPVTRAEGLAQLDYFLQHQLANFGAYQDALTERGPWLFHSRLSFLLNVKLLHPLEVVQAVVNFWEPRQQQVSLATVEGFVRQIIGWREYMRGVYWAQMPRYATLNYFDHQAALPSWYWTGQTKMRCLAVAIGQSLQHAYAHHIQRLMVTGNFALLLGVDPAQVDEWYLGIYLDAVEWVEITNTRGMSQFADGGMVGTKPYVSSANYINKMGDHCKNCYYDPAQRYGPRACPFNSLYWDFYARHANKLERNPRIGMMYRTWAKMAPAEQEKILEQAAVYKEKVEAL